ncbi:squalene-hopene cyclase [Rubidibacter lacunae KORDI 51-2]|uniref:Squalene-hopene cyclase n=1 Tax=Rubidibacter lacunae KORDI 51-2 TaxID=582515 RepID=U5DJB0_9CHRO|nr:squalene--hopene cyclase [Rubidibacter lacunae]ERN41781.1 squalene-hopene cyclase [Rubidibacter lacunae KORDI 51-2]
MQLHSEVWLGRLEEAVAASQRYLLSQQYPEGYWWAELEANVTVTVEVLLLHKIWRTDRLRPLHKIETYLRQQQCESGGWEVFYGDGGDLSTSVEAYLGLRLLGVPAGDPALVKARTFILERGGISKTRIFTKFQLALVDCYNWRGLPSIPPWIVFCHPPFPFSIYEMSSWARCSTVPLAIVFDKKPVYPVEPSVKLDELFAEGSANVRYELPRNNDWSDAFVWLDDAFKFAEDWNLVPLREEGLKAAERWIVERQEATGDWGGIIPAMVNSMLALRSLDYAVDDPIVDRGFQAIDNFVLEDDEVYRVQSCVSPVWDTAWVVRALVDSGMAPDAPEVVAAGRWLLERQILDYGDWRVKNPQGEPGGWAFVFVNRYYPDIDDTAVVVIALEQLCLPEEALKRQAIARATQWIATMQCRAGGWAAYDVDNDSDWLNLLPYSDLKATIDPNTADVTARVLEMVGYLDPQQPGIARERCDRALDYLLDEQESEGCWFGRWGVNYIYGTSGALSALALVAPQRARNAIERGAAWLVGVQNPDGGWGETCRSYEDPTLKGKGVSTASQTAWALIGLLAAGDATGSYAQQFLARGVEYLLGTQLENGRWEEAEFTGTGFPGHFYIRYHYYYQYFPLVALGRYRQFLAERT